MKASLCCSKCNDVIVKTDKDVSKLRCKLLVFKNGKSYAVCKGCDSEVEVPLSLDTSRLPDATPIYIRNKYR